ncbi:MAG: NRDE family protein [Gemmataceae bacterium]|nr:NRDE family protein [Gemmataceae bacterium]
MCTVTLIPLGAGRAAGLRIACNRDESRQRPAALSPQLRRFGHRSALLPVDPASDGTWIAANDAGLAMVLLNLNMGPAGAAPRPARPSRGTIIPSLLHCDDLHSAVRLACRLADQPLAPFRLVLANRTEMIEVAAAPMAGARGPWRLVERPRLAGPVLLTSSGLGDDLVEGPRRQLFEEWFPIEPSLSEEAIAARQDGFHRHSWPDRQHLSVCMRRADACTVSCTIIELRPQIAVMTYRPQPPDEAGPSVSLTLHGRPAGRA